MMRIVGTYLERCGVVFVAGIVLVALGCCVPVMGAKAPDAAFIAAALQRQESAYIDVVFTVSSKSTGAPDSKEVKDYLESHYIRTSDVLRITQKTNGPSKETTVSSWDRAKKEQRSLTTWGNGRSQGNIYHWTLVGGLQTQSLLDPARYYLSASSDNTTTFLYQWIKHATVSPKMETIKGHPCWKLAVDNPTLNYEKFEIWVDPKIGFCPRLVDTMRRGNSRCRTRFEDYVEVAPSIWLPKLQTIDLSTTKSHEAITVFVRAKDLKSGSKPGKASLIVNIPSGTRMYIDNSREPIVAP